MKCPLCGRRRLSHANARGELFGSRSGAGDEGRRRPFRATSGKIMWWQAAEILGISDRQLRRWRKRYEADGYDGLLDRRRGVPSGKRVPKARVQQTISLDRKST